MRAWDVFTESCEERKEDGRHAIQVEWAVAKAQKLIEKLWVR